MKKHTNIFILLAALISSPAMAQDIDTSERDQKTDLSNPDIISMPPMDPFDTFFTPPMPIGAENITTKEQCENEGGFWSKHDPDDYRVYGSITGCTKNEKKVGRWIIESKPQDEYESGKDGYIWFNDNNQREGWAVEGTLTPHHIVTKLTKFHNDLRDGPEFVWTENGRLQSVIQYKDDVREGNFESYSGMSCMPLLQGQMKNGLPIGVWQTYSSMMPGLLVLKRNYDKRLNEERPLIGNKFPEIVWTEWYNDKGNKYAEGYSVSDNPSDEMAIPYGDLQLYMSNGHPWIKIHYSEDKQGIIADNTINQLCSQQGVQHPVPPDDIDYDNDELIIKCLDHRNDAYTQLHYHSTGDFWKKVPLRDDTPNGTVLEYHPTGEVLAEYKVINGVPMGTIVYKDKEGNPMGSSSSSIDDKGNGVFNSYWFNGNRQESGTYQEFHKIGLWTKWRENGVIESEERFNISGREDGASREWYANGILANEINYVNGSRSGLLIGNYTDGRIGYQYYFYNDYFNSINYEYMHTGSIEHETDYRYGEPVRTYYYTSGQIKSRGKIQRYMGVRNDKWDFYTKSGEKWNSQMYSNGRVESKDAELCINKYEGQYFIDEDNLEIGCQVCAVNRETPLSPIKLREGKWTWWNDQGIIEKSGDIYFGHLNGEWSYYYPNGKIMLKGNYMLNKRIGEWIGYHEDGQKKFSGHYENGVENGIWKTFHAVTETVASEGSFINGKREGKWTYYYSDGTIKDQGEFKDNQETGPWTAFYKSEKKLSEGSFKDGKREGNWTWYREDGSIWKLVNYEDGKEIND